MKKFDKLIDVAVYQLCCGCGVCAYMHPEQIKKTDDPSFGRRPIKEELDDTDEKFSRALEICPGISLSHEDISFNQEGLDQLIGQDWGPIFELWEGYSADPEFCFTGSIGGVMSALALYCLERENIHV